MSIKNYFSKFIIGVLIGGAVLTTGCQSSQQLMEPTLSLKNKSPEFLDEIAIAGNTSNIKINAVNALKTEPAEKMPFVSNMLQFKYASILQVGPQAITNFPLYNFIEDWYGVRYRMGGKDKSGIDCSAFVQTLYNNVFCTNLFRTAFEQFRMCKSVWSKDSLKEGDLVFFKTRGKSISHVGIYLMNNFFVHASSSQGVIISSLHDRYWSRYYAGAGKIVDKEAGL